MSKSRDGALTNVQNTKPHRNEAESSLQDAYDNRTAYVSLHKHRNSEKTTHYLHAAVVPLDKVIIGLVEVPVVLVQDPNVQIEPQHQHVLFTVSLAAQFVRPG